MPGSHVLDVDREGPDGSPFGQVRAWGARGFEGILRGLRDPSSPLVLSQFISAGTAFLINIIASRALAPSGRGELALLLQIAYLSSLVMMFGTDRSLLAVYPGAAVRDVARTLSVSRNTVLTAYEEVVSRGLVRSRRGAGMYVLAPVGLSGFNLKAIMREAQYPSRTIALRDQDGNPLCIIY